MRMVSPALRSLVAAGIRENGVRFLKDRLPGESYVNPKATQGRTVMSDGYKVSIAMAAAILAVSLATVAVALS